MTDHDLQRCACMDCEDRRSVFVVEAWADLYAAIADGDAEAAKALVKVAREL